MKYNIRTIIIQYFFSNVIYVAPIFFIHISLLLFFFFLSWSNNFSKTILYRATFSSSCISLVAETSSDKYVLLVVVTRITISRITSPGKWSHVTKPRILRRIVYSRGLPSRSDFGIDYISHVCVCMPIGIFVWSLFRNVDSEIFRKIEKCMRQKKGKNRKIEE